MHISWHIPLIQSFDFTNIYKNCNQPIVWSLGLWQWCSYFNHLTTSNTTPNFHLLCIAFIATWLINHPRRCLINTYCVISLFFIFSCLIKFRVTTGYYAQNYVVTIRKAHDDVWHGHNFYITSLMASRFPSKKAQWSFDVLFFWAG